jgi:hypothetical protein
MTLWSGELNKSKLTWIKETFLPTTHNLWELGVGKDGSVYNTGSSIIKANLNAYIYVVYTLSCHITDFIPKIYDVFSLISVQNLKSIYKVMEVTNQNK